MNCIKTLVNADQIYSYLLKLKLNLLLGLNSNYKNTFYGYKNKCFHFVLENLLSSIGKNNHSPTRKTNVLAASHKKSNLESNPPYLSQNELSSPIAAQFWSHNYFGLDFHFYVIFLLIGTCQLDNV